MLFTPTEWVKSYSPGGYSPGPYRRYVWCQSVRGSMQTLWSFSTVWLALDKQYAAISAYLLQRGYLVQLSKSRSQNMCGQEFGHRKGAIHTQPSCWAGLSTPGLKPYHGSLREVSAHRSKLNPSIFSIWTNDIQRRLDASATSRRRLRSLKRCSTSIRKRILRHTLLGLSALHDSGITHGNLQSGNILL